MPLPPPKILICDLESRSFEAKVREDLSSEIGGLGIALPLFEEFLEKDPAIFSIGPASGVLPGCSKTLALFRSPYDQTLATSFAGGNLARVLRSTGFSALVILGEASQPSLVAVGDDQILFRDAGKIWGKSAYESYREFFSKEGIPSLRSILNIGPAGERKIAFSQVLVDEFFSFPRGGLGAKFGEKNLKGIVLSSMGSGLVKDPRAYQAVFLDLLKQAKSFTRLSSLGTLKNLEAGQKLFLTPLKNLSGVGKANISVESFPGESKRISCGGCPVGCIHIGLFPSPAPYDYEAVVSLGSLLGIEKDAEIMELILFANDLGFDLTSLGVVLGLLTESQNLSFGDLETYKKLVLAILSQTEDWASDLAKGLQDYVSDSELFDKALVLGGREALPYFNGYASLLTQSLGLGSTTEENRGFLLDLELYGKKFSDEELVDGVISGEIKKTLAQLMIGCGYLGEIYEDIGNCFAALNSLGFQFAHEFLEGKAKEVFFKKVKLNYALGFSPQRRFSNKFFQFPTAHDILDQERLWKMIEVFEVRIK